MVQLHYLLTVAAATFAASRPLEQLEKRTTGTANVKIFGETGCKKIIGSVTPQKYGQKYNSPMEDVHSVQYTGVHAGQAVKHIQLCVTYGDGSGEHCKTGSPGSAFCFSVGSHNIRTVEAIGIKG